MIAEKYDLTVLHSGNEIKEGTEKIKGTSKNLYLKSR
jgi:hypothetical protein